MITRMLITDDDPNLINLYHALFDARRDLAVDYASSPKACRAYLSHRRYDVALLDISLGDPKEDGIGLLEAIRAQCPDTDVLMMSSEDEEATVARCIRLGARTFTSKNRDFPVRLRSNVNALVANHAVLKQA